MSRRPILVGLVSLEIMAALPACGDEFDGDPVAFAEVCGQTGPVRLLELPTGRQLDTSSTPVRVAGRRWFRTTANIPLPGLGYVQLGGEAWSTGPCGESPRLHATDVLWVSTQRDGGS